MKRLLMLMLVVAAGYSQDPSLTDNQPNGLWWMQATPNERLDLILGAEAGFYEEQIEIAATGADCKHGPTYSEQVANGNKTRNDLRKEIDAFYNDGKNISRPLSSALLYAKMKLAGAPPAKIDEAQRILAK